MNLNDKQTRQVRSTKMLVIFVLSVCIDGLFPLGSPAQESEAADPAEAAKELSTRQNSLADRYKTLEQKLFKLHEFELNTNPDRSRLLKQAYEQSQEQLTQKQLSSIVQLLADKQWKMAVSGQEQTLADLKALLQLLESEDRSKRIRDRQDQVKEYIAEVDRILRIQKGIRGQNQGGVDQKRLAKSQNKAAERTRNLNQRIKEDEGEQEQSENKSDPEQAGEEESENRKGEQGPSSQEDSKDESKGKQDGKPSEKSDAEKSDGEKSDGEKSSGQKSNEKPQQGKPPQGKAGEQKQGAQQQQDENPVQKRIKAAEQRMKQAEEDLKQAKRAESIEEMEQAERDLAQAKKELEEILRQLREEEIERSLAALEDRFRRMLEKQIRIQEKTKLHGKTPARDRNTEFEILAGKLGVQQRNLATDADRTLLLLREDGSSIAFPETVEQMRDDMYQVASRLNAGRVEKMTQSIEADIIETLNDLIQSLITAQEEQEKKQQQQQPPGKQGTPGEQPLVDKIAELKMVRGLQLRINKRHARYAQLLEDPDDPIGYSNDPEIKSALGRLSERQQRVKNITRDIVQGKNN